MERIEWARRNLIPRKVEKVRVGRRSDGGYVLPKASIAECDLCVTYGLGHDTSFERQILSHGIKVIGYDPDISRHPSWARRGRLVSYSDFASMPEVSLASSVMLKVDVEGAEYGFLRTLDRQHFAEKVHTFALEIHVSEKLKPSWADIDLLQVVLESHHVVHVHGNNYGKTNRFFPTALEVTFMSKRRMGDAAIDRGRFPSEGLDFPNKPESADLCLMWVNQVPLL